MLDKQSPRGEYRIGPTAARRTALGAGCRDGPRFQPRSGIHHGSATRRIRFLTLGLVLLTAAVLSVPIARRMGLSAIVAYLIAGIVIGPYGLAAFATPESIVPVSELGVVMLLFLIGLELELGRLMAMRRDIFGLGAAQLSLTALA